MVFYEVIHLNEFLDEKNIGYFSSLEAAEKAVAQRSAEPGFKDFPGQFLTVKREIPSNGDGEKVEIYEAYIYYHSSELEYEFTHRIGFFTDLSSADEAAEWAKKHCMEEIPGIEQEYIVWKCPMDLAYWDGGYEGY